MNSLLKDSIPPFDDFLQAGTESQPEVAVSDPLGKFEQYVRRASSHIDAVDALIKGYTAGDDYEFGHACSPFQMANLLWKDAVGAVEKELLKASGVDVGPPHDWLQRALPGGNDRERLAHFTADRVRRFFATSVGDIREVRIRQLRERALHALRHARPEKQLRWHCGEHHREYSKTVLRLTYHDENLSAIEAVVRYIVHLATGSDPVNILPPVIAGWTDGKGEWRRQEVYRRQAKPFPGARSFRFLADFSVQIEFEPEILTRLQKQWDAVPREN